MHTGSGANYKTQYVFAVSAKLTDGFLHSLTGTAQDLSPGVVELSTDAEYEAAMKDVADKDARAVVDFTATWCGPCESQLSASQRAIGPTVSR